MSRRDNGKQKSPPPAESRLRRSASGTTDQPASETEPSMASAYNRVRVADLLNAEAGSSSRARDSGRGSSRKRSPKSDSESPPPSDFQCPIPHCRRRFPTQQSLAAHQKRSHPLPTPYVCPHCRSTFSTSPNLNKHIRSVHEKVKPFQCNQCNSCFAFRDGLYRHTRMVHDQVRPYPCPYCSLRFKTKSHLVKHTTALHPNAPLPSSDEGSSAAGPSSKKK